MRPRVGLPLEARGGGLQRRDGAEEQWGCVEAGVEGGRERAWGSRRLCRRRRATAPDETEERVDGVFVGEFVGELGW